MNIYLTGFMGSGKSTAGQLLAVRMRRKFIDTDSEIERRKGMEVTEIFKQYGESAFRELEKELLGELSLKTDLVVATGGGMVLNQQNVERMKEGVMFYLKAPVDVLAARLLRQRAIRPLIAALHEDELPGFINEQLLIREPSYRLAHFTIDANQPAERICLEIERLLGHYSR